jgi:prepilin-type N-terminal cleavage/methylation domain-containing protein/prepilin-type processing-associated H-X9-DG protein
MGRSVAKAFTLIELLVVVAIIALLVAILIPSLANARAQAKKVICLSNAHSLARAHLLYAESYHGCLPHSNGWLWDGQNGSSQRSPLCPRSGELFGERYDADGHLVGRGANYVSFPEVFLCPMDGLQRRDVPAHGTKAIRPPSFSYARNKMVYQTLADAGRISPEQEEDGHLRVGVVPRLSDTPLMLEEHELSGMNDGYINYNDWDQLTLRHNKKAMVAYYDGHAGGMDGLKYNDASRDGREKLVAPGIRRAG